MRRRFLMGMVLDKGIWENYSYTYLYHSLIPQTIDSKNVLNKARLGTIEGNSEVVNQLITDSGSHPSYQSWTIDNSAGSSALYATQQWNCDSSIRLVIGHKYLIWFVGTKSYSGNGACRLYPNVANQQAYVFDFKTQNANIITVNSIEAPTSTPTLNTIVGAGTTLTIDGYLCFTDLTKRYPFDTPTTLDDVRVQNILAQGYIPFNTGEIKDTLISELEAQQYNLFDEILESGAYDTDTGQPLSDNRFERSKNYISVVGGLQYSLENSGEINTYQYAQRHILEYDGNYNFIRADIQYNNQSQFLSQFNQTLDNNCRYIRINFYYGSTQRTITDVCFHRTGTRTGYAPYQAPSTLQLPAPLQISGVNTAHNTFEVTNTGFVFTRNTWDYTFPSQNWEKEGEKYYTYLNVSDDLRIQGCDVSEVGNILCADYLPATQLSMSNGTKDNCVSVGASQITKVVCVRDTTHITDTTTARTYMVGKTVRYQLHTPQVITIPKKHLWCVDLSTIQWSQGSSAGQFWWQTTEIPNIKYVNNNTQVGNAYCNNYITRQASGFSNVFTNALAIDITNFKVKTDGLQNGEKPTGILFFETEDEVADFTNSVNIQSGGTLNSDSVVLPNVEMEMKCK